MKKKHTRRLRLTKETLRQLNRDTLNQAEGGGAVEPNSPYCGPSLVDPRLCEGEV